MDRTSSRIPLPELLIFTAAAVMLMQYVVQEPPEQTKVQLISPWLSARQHFVIGRPASLSGARIRTIDAQIEVVVAGSFWTTYSFDIVRHGWCKTYAGYAGAINRTDIPDSALAGVFGSLHRYSVNVSLRSTTDTRRSDLCTVITPVNPTRYDSAPKVNVKLTYQYQKSGELAVYKLLALLAWVMMCIPLIHWNFEDPYELLSEADEQEGRGSTLEENDDVRSSSDDDGAESERQQPVRRHSKDTDYEFILPSGADFRTM